MAFPIAKPCTGATNESMAIMITGSICPLCNKRLATVHLTEVDEDGTIHQLHSCSQCLHRLHVELGDQPTPIAEILYRNAEDAGHDSKNLVGPLSAVLSENLDQASHDTTCPNCGISWNDFIKRNRFGCEHDVEVFAEHLKQAVHELHAADHHQGRSPDQHLDPQHQQRRHHQELQQQLQQAVRNEHFERAAALRDEIRDLESRLP